jgi:cell wall-associated NlpC family hydrolase
VAVLSAQQIYQACRQAAFTPAQAVTMKAIALTESSGNTEAHASSGEDSWGLFQINREAHPQYSASQLTDPVTNAKAAFEVSGGGSNISPWTVTHGGSGARYLAHQQDALAAAAAFGEGNVHGNFAGVTGYGDVEPASLLGDVGASPFDLTPPTAASSSNGGAERFVDAALAQVGDAYVFGAEADPNDPNPSAFDCSELVQWAAAQAGVDVGDPADEQFMRLKSQGGQLSVEQALHTRGALLFRFSREPVPGDSPPDGHVAISLGDGRTVEARGKDYGVMIVDAETNKDRFDFAAAIPSLGAANPAVPSPATGSLLPTSLTGAPAALPTSATLLPQALAGASGDADQDGVSDGLETLFGTNAQSKDSDHDGLSDAFELFVTHTNPTSADSDGDGTADNLELALGRDPRSPDGSSGAGQAYSLFLGAGPDSDHDGIADAVESAMGLSPTAADSDGDGLSDAFELAHGLNPAKADSDGDGLADSLAMVLGKVGGGGATTVGGSPLDVLAGLAGGSGTGAGHGRDPLEAAHGASDLTDVAAHHPHDGLLDDLHHGSS